jgi:YD repeat-containing protein
MLLLGFPDRGFEPVALGTHLLRVAEFGFEIYNEKYEHVGQFGELGTAAGKFNGAEGVAIDQSGNVWVTDWGNNRVEEFSAEGKFELAFGECGGGSEKLSHPQGIAIYNGTVYVENFAQNRIDEYTETGGCAGEFGEAGSGNGQLSNATWMTFSSTGTLYVADAGNNRIEEFSSAGAYLTAFGVKGAGTSEFSEPEGVALASSGELYVTDSSNERIEEWTPPVQAVHDSKIIYYSQAANAAYPGCGGHPEWAYLPCETVPGAQPQSPGLPGLPEATTTYNVWDEPLTSTEKVGSQTRTTTNTYDAAGRVKTTAVTSTTGKAVAPVSNEYSSETGALIKQTSEESGKPTLKSAFNTLGQLTSYTDASGNTSTYTYDEYGRPKSVFDGKGTQTYSYDPTTDEVTGLLLRPSKWPSGGFGVGDVFLVEVAGDDLRGSLA